MPIISSTIVKPRRSVARRSMVAPANGPLPAALPTRPGRRQHQWNAGVESATTRVSTTVCPSGVTATTVTSATGGDPPSRIARSASGPNGSTVDGPDEHRRGLAPARPAALVGPDRVGVAVELHDRLGHLQRRLGERHRLQARLRRHREQRVAALGRHVRDGRIGPRRGGLAAEQARHHALDRADELRVFVVFLFVFLAALSPGEDRAAGRVDARRGGLGEAHRAAGDLLEQVAGQRQRLGLPRRGGAVGVGGAQRPRDRRHAHGHQHRGDHRLDQREPPATAEKPTGAAAPGGTISSRRTACH